MARTLSTIEVLALRYSALMTIPEVAEAIKFAPQTIRNQMVEESFPIPSHKNKAKRRVCYLVDVAEYLDRQKGLRVEVISRRGRPTKADQIRSRGGVDDDAQQ